MFRKKKAPPPNPPPGSMAGLQGFNSQSISAFAAQQALLPSGFRAPIISAMSEEAVAPEPKDEPRTVVGLTGYRLYTLDNELYLCGQQRNRQKGRESEQAKHNGGNFDHLTLTTSPVNHLAPAWDCLCGFAAFFWPTSLEQPEWNGVLAEVQAGGRTIYCETGWRAERIALSKLWVACPIFPDAALETLRERYEVPVAVL